MMLEDRKMENEGMMVKGGTPDDDSGTDNGDIDDRWADGFRDTGRQVKEEWIGM